MYNFIDVNEASEATAILPSEAFTINGEYIENQIEGYRTLSVTGREALSPELTTYETGIRDGSVLQNKRFPARILTVTYQLIAKTNEAFRAAYNKLASVLNVEEAELIFNDEQDKFFIGTPSAISEVEPGRNAVVGSFEIVCADPFKYSVQEYEATADLDESSIFVDYNGTYRSYPKLQAEFYNEDEASEDGETVKELSGAGDCGYVAFFNEKENIIQLGDPEEVDIEDGFAKSQTMLNQKFNKSTSWGTAAKSLWGINSGKTSSSSVTQAGSLKMGVAAYTKAGTPTTTSGTLLNDKISDEGSPYVWYNVKAKTSGRTANSVKVTFTISSWLHTSQSYLGTGYGLYAHVYIGGEWKGTTIKRATTYLDYWEGRGVHVTSFTVTVSGLSASTTSLTGIKFKVTRTDSNGKAGILGETACSPLKISNFPTAAIDSYYLCANSYGTGSKWHGPSITRVIPADSAGEVGAKNFTLSYAQKMAIGSASSAQNQLGAFQVLLVSGSGSNRKYIAGVYVYKSKSGKKATLRFYLNGAVAQDMTVDLSSNNKYFKSSKSSTIKKSGNTITYDICGIKKTFKDDDIADVVVNEVTFTFMQYGTKTPLANNGLYWAKFVKNNCDTWKQIPNKFSANDIVEADCSEGEIYLNGSPTPELGALGNDWEEFYLTPGINQIGFAYSEWVEADYAPTFKLKYREVFI
jgi:predicted phage tail component-like protein